MSSFIPFIVVFIFTTFICHGLNNQRAKFSKISSAIRMTSNCDQSPLSILQSHKSIPSNIKDIILPSFLSIILSASSVCAKPLSEEEKALQFNQKPDPYSASVSQIGVKPDYKSVINDIEELIYAKPAKGPTFVRLAWHSSGTYDKMTKTGGSERGTIRFKEELDHDANAGLDLAVSWLEPIYKKFNRNTDLSYADLYTLAGVVAIKTLGGPKIKWRAGRVDSVDLADVTPNGRLPDADKGSPAKTAQGLRDVFYRMGFDDRQIVALSGAHALGRCHATASGYVGYWTPTPDKFNNLYFKLLKDVKWTPNEKSSKFQYKDPSGTLMMLPSDLVLIEDEGFKKYVDIYAKDQNLFFKDFSDAFSELLELGTSNLYEVQI